jgi:hypothetical protein
MILDLDSVAEFCVRTTDDPEEVVLYEKRVLEDGRHAHPISIHFDMRSEQQHTALRRVLEQFDLFRAAHAPGIPKIDGCDQAEVAGAAAGTEQP